MSSIKEYYFLKYNKIEEPYMYLGEIISKMSLEGGKTCQTMLAEHHIKEKQPMSKIVCPGMEKDFHQSV